MTTKSQLRRAVGRMTAEDGAGKAGIGGVGAGGRAPRGCVGACGARDVVGRAGGQDAANLLALTVELERGVGGRAAGNAAVARGDEDGGDAEEGGDVAHGGRLAEKRLSHHARSVAEEAVLLGGGVPLGEEDEVGRGRGGAGAMEFPAHRRGSAAHRGREEDERIHKPRGAHQSAGSDTDGLWGCVQRCQVVSQRPIKKDRAKAGDRA